MAGESIVARVVGRHGHDGSGAISGQHIFGNPDGNLLASEWVDGIRTRENARHLVVHLSFALGALLHISQILLYFGLLFSRGELFHQFAFRSQHHERNAENGVGARGEDGELQIRVGHTELHLRTF